MSINPKNSRGQNRRFQKLESAASAAILATAVFAATPRSAQAFIYITAGDQSWFNSSNWARNPLTNTGTLPETVESVGPGPDFSDIYIDINALNPVVPAQGVLFDPANDALTPGGPNAHYIANLGSAVNPTTLYVSDAVGQVTSTTSSAPNKLTIESGTIQAWLTSVGRDGPGVIVQNGGVFLTVGAKVAIQSQSDTQTIGSGTFEYHGGTMIAGNQIQIGTENLGGPIGNTSAGVGRFVVYNDGPDGAILATNGMHVAGTTTGLGTAGAGTIGIVEFHYDLNTHNVGNTRPIQDDFNTTNGQLVLQNSSTTSARLNLLLDAVPTVTNGQVQNLGLFKTQGAINNFATTPALFYSLDGLNVFTQGATIAAAYSGIAYSWTISYSGVISFDNSATSAYTTSDISATGGADIVLVGVPVPEPGSIALLGGAASMILARRRRKSISK
jgi:hypothetical protein